MHVGRTKAGLLTPPFRRLQPLDLISSAANVDEATFFAAIAASQHIAERDRTASDLKALQTIVKPRPEEQTSELQSLLRNTYAFFGLKTKKNTKKKTHDL